LTKSLSSSTSETLAVESLPIAAPPLIPDPELTAAIMPVAVKIFARFNEQQEKLQLIPNALQRLG